jgi:hypothetical protein
VARGNSGGTGDVHILLHGPTNINSNYRQQMAGELMGQRLPRRELHCGMMG